MNLEQITPLLITYNEQANIARTLSALAWARQILVVDSGSTDATAAILAADTRVRILVRPFDNFADQCNFGLRHVDTEYVLSLDADHVMTPELVNEIRALAPGRVAGWEIPFRYCVDGRPLRASLLPPRVVLFARQYGKFANDGHAHHAVLSGVVGRLRARLLHDDRKPLQRWLTAQLRYCDQESAKLRGVAFGLLPWPDRLRRLGLGPLLVVPYCLLFKGLLLDGRAGFFYTLQRLLAEVLLVLFLFDPSRGRVR